MTRRGECPLRSAPRGRQFNEAIKDFTETIRANPEHARAYMSRADIFASQGENGKAIADYTIAIELKPKWAEAFYNRGLAYKSNGQQDEAVADFTEAIKLNPKREQNTQTISFRAGTAPVE